MTKLHHIIKCPFCEAEYMPEEIFYPDSVFNKNLQVIRDEKGKIVFINEDSFNFIEEFECECCNNKFQVEGKVNFQTKKIEEDTFEEETIVNL